MIEKHWTDRLSDYIDGEVEAPEAAAIEAHIEDCAACRSTLEELRQVVTAAAALPDREPAADLLPGILERIHEGDEGTVVPLRPSARAARRFTFTLPQLAAAAMAVITLSAGAAWLAAKAGAPEAAVVVAGQPEAPTDEPLDDAGQAALFVSDTQVGYEAAIDRLERALADRREDLDPETVAVIERNLEIIDGAIAEARAALEADPSNAYLYRHLDNTLNQKVELLRRATRRTAI